MQKTNNLFKNEDVKKLSKFWTQMDFECIPFKYLNSIYLEIIIYLYNYLSYGITEKCGVIFSIIYIIE